VDPGSETVGQVITPPTTPVVPPAPPAPAPDLPAPTDATP
jgi:hypothetical protein